MRWLLDTNIVIAAMKGRAEVCARLEEIPQTDIVLSTIVLGELAFGAEKSSQQERNRSRIAELAQRLPPVALDADAATHYGHTRAALERAGTPIGANDLWIAAQALALDATLVTDNVGEFSRIHGLKIENWLTR